MAETIFGMLRKRITADIESLQRVLHDDRIKDMEHYRNITGQLRGLSVSLGYVKDLEAKVDNDWED